MPTVILAQGTVPAPPADRAWGEDVRLAGDSTMPKMRVCVPAQHGSVKARSVRASAVTTVPVPGQGLQLCVLLRKGPGEAPIDGAPASQAVQVPDLPKGVREARAHDEPREAGAPQAAAVPVRGVRHPAGKQVQPAGTPEDGGARGSGESAAPDAARRAAVKQGGGHPGTVRVAMGDVHNYNNGTII